MKTIYTILLVLLILPRTWGADQVFIDEFKKISNGDERLKMIDQAPPEQRDELKKIDLHLRLLDRCEGEAGLKAARESQVAGARGVGCLQLIFGIQMQIWDSYIGGALIAAEKAGMTPAQQADVVKVLTEEKEHAVGSLACL
jgi:hypothetical protein